MVKKVLEKLSKVLFWGAIIYYIIMVLVNMESTFYFNATQYVPEGENPEQIRIAEIIRDIVSPAYSSLILISLSFITKHFSKTE